ncbi:hypothetical protein CFP56_017594 [Quercus suber]|uniref:Uncharacterized protein n=1 Tax=Quercus suber TaxID=58331 RepID=A0AAW0KMR4_QUESU
MSPRRRSLHFFHRVDGEARRVLWLIGESSMSIADRRLGFMGLLEMDWLLCLWVYFLG